MADAAQRCRVRMADDRRRAESPWMSLEEMMRLTRTIVLRALLGADLGPFTAGVDQAWTIINEHVGESFWSLGLTDRLPTPKYRRFQAAQAVLRGAVDHVDQPAPPQPDRQRRPAFAPAVRARRGDRRGDDGRAAARRGHDVSAGRSGDDVAGVDVDLVPAVAASRTRNGGSRKRSTSCSTGVRPIRRSRESAVHPHGDRRSHAAVPACVGLLAAGAGRR